MPDARNDYTIVYVGGPENGRIEVGDGAMMLLLLCGYLPGKNESAVGRRVRSSLPWYIERGCAAGLSPQEVAEVLAKAGIAPGPSPLYSLESVGDPIIMRFVEGEEVLQDG